MIRIIDNRSSGKTGRLMLLAKDTEGSIVCANPRALEEKARAYGIVGINFISYYDFLHSIGTDIGKYYIDELESFLKYVQNSFAGEGEFSGYTLSVE